ncbi:MAG: hypothetical protein Q7S01_01910 [bacterium]|nr:hypothetical protein [bacterium]
MYTVDHWENAEGDLREGELELKELCPNLDTARAYLEASRDALEQARDWQMIPDAFAEALLVNRQETLERMIGALAQKSPDSVTSLKSH